MDTAWFAVDRDGHVGLLETGESGAVPSIANIGEDHYELVQTIRKAVPKSPAVRDLAGLRRVHESMPHFPSRGTWSVLVFLKEVDDALKARLSEIGAREVDASEGHAFVVPKAFPNKAFFDDVHARELCLGCFVEIEDDDEQPNVAEHGLYRYEHTEDNWIAGPYAQVGRPKSPVNIADLPAEISTKAIVYEGSFAEGKPIQPAEIWESESWGPTWLATDGKTVRPFDGRVDEMDEVEGNYEGQGELVVLRDPLEGVAEGRLYEGAAAPEASDARDEQESARDSDEPPKPEPPEPKKKPWWKLW